MHHDILKMTIEGQHASVQTLDELRYQVSEIFAKRQICIGVARVILLGLYLEAGAFAEQELRAEAH